jgi:predicted nucleic acid-binding protein
VFLDTNVLVVAAIPTAPKHGLAREALRKAVPPGKRGTISRQILREFMAVLTRPSSYHRPPAFDAVASAVRRFENRFEIIKDGPAVTARLVDLLSVVPCGGKQIHDANIVATMLVHGIDQLLTDNESDFGRFADVIEIVALSAS